MRLQCLESAWYGPGRLLAPKRTNPTNPQTAFGAGRWERPSPEMCPRRCGSGPCFAAPRPVGTRFLPPHCHRNHSRSRGREGGAGGKAQRSPSPAPSLVRTARRARGPQGLPTALYPLPRGRPVASLTRARLSQQLDNGDIGEDDVAFRHGLRFHGLAAWGPSRCYCGEGRRG